MPEYVYSIVFIVIIGVVVMLWNKKREDDVWEGELIKKNFNRGDEDTSASFFLVFRTDDGKKKRFNTPSVKYWDEWEVGDRGKKVKGEFFPSKI